MSKKDIKPSQIKLLWGKGQGRCAVCKENLIKSSQAGKEFQVGEMAHIEGENPGSARYNPDMTDDQRAAYENLILLCPTHHAEIDKDQHQYPVEKLKQIKTDHEKWVEDSLRSQLPEITFAELEVILKYLTDAPIPIEDESITVVPPGRKIKKNDLSVGVGNLITIGMMQVKLVEDYLNKHPDAQFAARLSKGFVGKYDELRENGLWGDVLFYELFDFASYSSMDFRRRTAGLSVLVYFFEKCKVFESPGSENIITVIDSFWEFGTPFTKRTLAPVAIKK